MASSGPNNPGTLANDAAFGTVAWTNPGNAAASDNSRATASLSATASSQYLKATNPGFALPAASTIDGIIVEVERSNGAGIANVADSRVRIVKGGTIGSTDKATATPWPVSSVDSIATYGSSSDKWGETWTDSDINSSGFGVVVSARRTGGKGPNGGAQIDHIRITVHYTAAVGGNTARSFVVIC